MVTYDPAILVVFATRLYAQAQRVVILMALAGGAFGLFSGFVFGMAGGFHDAAPFLAVVGAVFMCIVGVVIGLERAFAYKLEAQRTLCLLQTEINTRTEATVAAMARGVPPGGPAAPPRA